MVSASSSAKFSIIHFHSLQCTSLSSSSTQQPHALSRLVLFAEVAVHTCLKTCQCLDALPVIWVLGHIQICKLWVRHSPCCTLFLINCFGIEMVLCDLYLKKLIWQRVCYLTLSHLLFGTNYVVIITQYWSWNHFYHQWIGRQNKKLQIKCIPV